MPDESQVLAAERAFFAALIGGRPDNLDPLLLEDFTLVDLSGSLVTKSALLLAVGSGQLKFDVIDPVESQVRCYADTAIVVGRTRMEGRFQGEPFTFASRYTHVYRDHEGSARLVAAQGTPIAE
jgi:hypothetical protein